MKQVLQSYRTGELRLADVPAPGVEPGCILVLTSASLVSIGTERMTMGLAKKSLAGKARERPDLVKKVLARVARDGIAATVDAVRNKLDSPIPLGYSCVGRAVAVGDGVPEITVGMRVACAGAKVANHAEVNLVPRNLCVSVPDGVDDETAAFVTVGAVALQGVRAAAPTLGETFAVVGLGLVGQLSAQLLRAGGCRVMGIDLDPAKVALARRLGAEAALLRSDDVVQTAHELTGGRGVDGVLITAATASNDPVALAGELCRDRGRVVAVGAVGMDVPRRPYYDKELTLLQSRSYGPGRYDPVYEEAGVDYPIGYVRWTERRNMEAFLDQCASGRVRVAELVTHRFGIERAQEAYEIVGKDPAALGVLFTYPARDLPSRTITIAPRPTEAAPPVAGALSVAFIGAGAFAAGTLVPALAATPRVRLTTIASARGFSAQHLAERHGFGRCTTDAQAAIADPDVDAVFIATRHDLHAQQAAAALRAGKHVFVEKPLAIDEAGLAEVLAAHAASSSRTLLVGFNRRFSPLVAELAGFFAGRRAPLVMSYRINAGLVPADSWIHDPAVGGGRIVGEVCHFIDVVSFLAGAHPTSVFTQGIGAAASACSDDNVILALRFADGSLATIMYVASGDPAAGKERLEVIGAGACAALEDFRTLDLRRDGKQRVIRKLAQDKGHRAEVAAFVGAARIGAAPPPIALASLAATTRATFAALESLATGQPVSIDVSA